MSRPLTYREAIRIDLANAIYGRGLRPLARWTRDDLLADILASYGFVGEARELRRSPHRLVTPPRAFDARAIARRP